MFLRPLLNHAVQVNSICHVFSAVYQNGIEHSNFTRRITQKVCTVEFFFCYKNNLTLVCFGCNRTTPERTPDRTAFASKFDVFAKV